MLPLPRLLALLRRHLGRAVAVTYVAAAVLPAPGLWLRHPHATGIAELPLRTPQLLLALVLFGAGLQVPLRELRLLVRRPAALLAGLALHILVPLLIVPGVALALGCRRTTTGQRHDRRDDPRRRDAGGGRGDGVDR